MNSHGLASPPKQHSITTRPVKFNITNESPVYWMGGDPFKSHFWNAFFTTFPPGETFFVRSVLNYRDQIDDDQLQSDINSFAGQEGAHANSHQDHLDTLTHHGYKSLERENRIIDIMLKYMTDKFPKISLVNTLAMEHFTALLAHQILADHALFLDEADPDFIALFKWHALEEIEHKAVAFDVYMAVDGRYWPRALAMVIGTVALMSLIPVRMTPLLYKDGLLFKGKLWWNGMKFLFKPNEGLFVRPWKHYLQFYRRNFHPWDVDDHHLVEPIKEIYDDGKMLEIAHLEYA